MKKILFLLAFLFVLPLNANAQEKKPAVYFYADWCSHCQKVNAYFEENGIYEKYDIQKLNFDEPENKKILSKIFEDQGMQSSGIPAIIIDEQMLVGDAPIIKQFETTIEKSKGTAPAYVEKFREGGQSASAVPLAALISAALVDAINPCAFAVLILLVATVTNAQGKRRALQSGLMFSLAIFASYFLMGLGLYKAITIFNIPLVISTVVGLLAILLGLANLKDAFWYGKFFIMEVPLSWRPRMQTILKHVTSPFGALSAGLLVSLFLLPCSSGPYVVIVGLLAERVNMASTISQLALYNLIFVTPMVAITLAMYFFDIKGKKLEQLRKDNLKLLHAIGGTIMLIMGIYLLKGWL
ncbi:MAG: Cytochrome c biogenesis protein [Candidatus Moranbacteria bacterium GW2011_GWC2_37_8]|nr:MAG: Cytochrome c biogenesis protein [Candidatus Moranbacteria bacterium GW2011_GWC2_37_8]KKQ60867.1 MAG: cytochrome c biogenesis protein transmembrane region [Parcubacteria group bacterium GW2011_GWC1_38_22]